MTILQKKWGEGVIIHYPFGAKVTAFFNEYLHIPENFFEENGVLTAGAMQVCANQLIGLGVFKDEKDMKLEAIKSYYIILPDWIFIETKE